MKYRRGALLGALVVVASCSSGSKPSASPATTGALRRSPVITSTTAAPAAEAPVNLSDKGQAQSKTFALAGGSYAVHFQSGGDCYYSASLVATPGPGTFPADLATANSATVVDSNVHDVAAGSYYVNVITGPAPTCSWALTLTPSG